MSWQLNESKRITCLIRLQVGSGLRLKAGSIIFLCLLSFRLSSAVKRFSNLRFVHGLCYYSNWCIHNWWWPLTTCRDYKQTFLIIIITINIIIFKHDHLIGWLLIVTRRRRRRRSPSFQRKSSVPLSVDFQTVCSPGEVDTIPPTPS